MLKFFQQSEKNASNLAENIILQWMDVNEIPTVDPMSAQNYSNIVFGSCNCVVNYYTAMHISYGPLFGTNIPSRISINSLE